MHCPLEASLQVRSKMKLEYTSDSQLEEPLKSTLQYLQVELPAAYDVICREFSAHDDVTDPEQLHAAMRRVPHQHISVKWVIEFLQTKLPRLMEVEEGFRKFVGRKNYEEKKIAALCRFESNRRNQPVPRHKRPDSLLHPITKQQLTEQLRYWRDKLLPDTIIHYLTELVAHQTRLTADQRMLTADQRMVTPELIKEMCSDANMSDRVVQLVSFIIEGTETLFMCFIHAFYVTKQDKYLPKAFDISFETLPHKLDSIGIPVLTRKEMTSAVNIHRHSACLDDLFRDLPADAPETWRHVEAQLRDGNTQEAEAARKILFDQMKDNYDDYLRFTDLLKKQSCLLPENLKAKKDLAIVSISFNQKTGKKVRTGEQQVTEAQLCSDVQLQMPALSMETRFAICNVEKQNRALKITVKCNKAVDLDVLKDTITERKLKDLLKSHPYKAALEHHWKIHVYIELLRPPDEPDASMPSTVDICRDSLGYTCPHQGYSIPLNIGDKQDLHSDNSSQGRDTTKTSSPVACVSAAEDTTEGNTDAEDSRTHATNAPTTASNPGCSNSGVSVMEVSDPENRMLLEASAELETTKQTIKIHQLKKNLIAETILQSMRRDKAVDERVAREIENDDTMDNRAEHLLDVVAKSEGVSMVYHFISGMIQTGQAFGKNRNYINVPSAIFDEMQRKVAYTARGLTGYGTRADMRKCVEAQCYSYNFSAAVVDTLPNNAPFSGEWKNLVGLYVNKNFVSFEMRTDFFKRVGENFWEFEYACQAALKNGQHHLTMESFKVKGIKVKVSVECSCKSTGENGDVSDLCNLLASQVYMLSSEICIPVTSVTSHNKTINICFQAARQELVDVVRDVVTAQRILELFKNVDAYRRIEQVWEFAVSVPVASQAVSSVGTSAPSVPQDVSLLSSLHSVRDENCSYNTDMRSVESIPDSASYQNQPDPTFSVPMPVEILETISNKQRKSSLFHTAVVNFKSRNNIDVHRMRDHQGKNILELCVHHGRLSFMRLIFFLGLFQNMTTPPTSNSEKMTKVLTHYIQWEKALASIQTYAREGIMPKVKAAIRTDPVMIQYEDNYENSSVLYMAVVSGNLQLVMYLVGAGCSTTCRTKSGDCILTCAARLTHFEIVHYCLEELKLDAYSTDGEGNNILDLTMFNSDVKLAKYLLMERKMLLNKQKALQIIIHSSTVEFLSWCLSENLVQITSRLGNQGLTALMVAVLSDRVDMVEFLFDKGVDYRALDKHDENVLHKLTYIGSSKIANVLLPLLKERNALSSMCSVRNKSVCKDKVQLIKIRKNDTQHWYYMNIDREIIPEVRLLLSDNCTRDLDLSKYGLILCNGVGDPDLSRDQIIERNNSIPSNQLEPDCTPLMLALLHGHEDLAVQLLLETSQPSQGDCNRLTPAHVAAMYGWMDVMIRLCRKGVPVDVPSRSGATARDLAVKYGHPQIITYIKSATFTYTATKFHNDVLIRFARIFNKETLSRLRDEAVDIRTHIVEQAKLLQIDLHSLFYQVDTCHTSHPSEVTVKKTMPKYITKYLNMTTLKLKNVSSGEICRIMVTLQDTNSIHIVKALEVWCLIDDDCKAVTEFVVKCSKLKKFSWRCHAMKDDSEKISTLKNNSEIQHVALSSTSESNRALQESNLSDGGRDCESNVSLSSNAPMIRNNVTSIEESGADVRLCVPATSTREEIETSGNDFFQVSVHVICDMWHNLTTKASHLHTVIVQEYCAPDGSRVDHSLLIVLTDRLTESQRDAISWHMLGLIDRSSQDQITDSYCLRFYNILPSLSKVCRGKSDEKMQLVSRTG